MKSQSNHELRPHSYKFYAFIDWFCQLMEHCSKKYFDQQETEVIIISTQEVETFAPSSNKYLINKKTFITRDM
ncbi:hypothetical protein FF1_040982 [Malus domestica]